MTGGHAHFAVGTERPKADQGFEEFATATPPDAEESGSCTNREGLAPFGARPSGEWAMGLELTPFALTAYPPNACKGQEWSRVRGRHCLYATAGAAAAVPAGRITTIHSGNPDTPPRSRAPGPTTSSVPSS